LKEIKTIRNRGVFVRSDMCLYEQFDYDEHAGAVVLLSIYGADQQVQAIFASLVADKDIRVEGEPMRLRRSGSHLVSRSRVLGRGKRHMLIWNHRKMESSPIWMRDDEKDQAMENFLMNRKVPYDKEYLDAFEQKILEERILVPLEGWGSVRGYLVPDSSSEHLDNKLCKYMLEVIREDTDEKEAFGSNTFMRDAQESTEMLGCVT